jgi:hypothetical protein
MLSVISNGDTKEETRTKGAVSSSPNIATKAVARVAHNLHLDNLMRDAGSSSIRKKYPPQQNLDTKLPINRNLPHRIRRIMNNASAHIYSSEHGSRKREDTMPMTYDHLPCRIGLNEPNGPDIPT